MKKIVADASIILKWVLGEETENDFPAAYKILDDFINENLEIHLPEIWKYEVGNVLGIKQSKESTSLMEVLIDYSFTEHILNKKDCIEILKLQSKISFSTFYDISYHYIAMKIGGILITSDNKYYQSAKKLGFIKLTA